MSFPPFICQPVCLFIYKQDISHSYKTILQKLVGRKVMHQGSQLVKRRHDSQVLTIMVNMGDCVSKLSKVFLGRECSALEQFTVSKHPSSFGFVTVKKEVRIPCSDITHYYTVASQPKIFLKCIYGTEYIQPKVNTIYLTFSHLTTGEGSFLITF